MQKPKSDSHRDLVPEVVLIHIDRKIPSRDATNHFPSRRPRRRSSRRLEPSSNEEGEKSELGNLKSDVATRAVSSFDLRSLIPDATEDDDGTSSNELPSSRKNTYKESFHLLPDDKNGDDDDDSDAGSIDIVQPRRRPPRRRLQRRSSLDPGMLRGGSDYASAARPRSSRNKRRPARRSSVQHQSEPAVTFSYSDENLSSSVSDLDTDEDELVGGILSSSSRRRDGDFLNPDDDARSGDALILPYGLGGTNSDEELMPLGDLCASLMPPKIVDKKNQTK